MNRKTGPVLLVLLAGLGWARAAAPDEGPASVRALWERFRQALPPVSFEVLDDRVVPSDSDPRRRLRRLEVRFTSQVAGQWERRMDHTAVLFIPAEPEAEGGPRRRDRAVIVTGACGDRSIQDNYGEPIASLTGYPTMVLPNPGEYDGHDGESCWVYFFRALLQDTGDPVNHQYFRFAVPYLRALDVLEKVLGGPVRAVIGGHSKRAPAAFNAAAADPERVAGVVYMGMESTFSAYEGKAWEGISPARSQDLVACPVLYLGATNEDGYAMFNIARLQERLKKPWTLEVIPNYRHAANSEVQILDWRMWIAHVFDGRPVTRLGGFEARENAEGTVFRAAVETPNKVILAKVWYVYCDDVPYWRDLMWYPALMTLRGEKYEAFVPGKLPDAWLVEVKDIASGCVGYVSSAPLDITGKPVAERISRGWRSRNWEPKKTGTEKTPGETK